MKAKKTSSAVPERLKTASERLLRGDYSGAVDVLTPLVKQLPEYFQAQFLMGAAQLAAHRPALALPCLLKAAALEPLNLQVLSNLGICYQSLGDLKLSLQYHKATVDIKPTYAEGYYNIGFVYMEKQEWLPAIGNFTTAIEYQNKYSDAYINLSNCLRQLKKFKDAIAVCDAYTNNYGSESLIIFNKCRSLFDSGLKATAIKTLLEQVDLLPETSDLYILLGIMYSRSDNHQEAISCYKKSIAIDPHNFKTFSNLGTSLVYAGLPTDGINAFEQAIILDPTSPLPHKNIANIYNTIKRYDLAIKHLEIARHLDKDDTYVHSLLVQNKIYTCAWTGLQALANVLKIGLLNDGQFCNPFPPIAYLESQRELTNIANGWVTAKHPGSHFFPAFKPLKKLHKIKLGYFSADFHDHATAQLMVGLLEQHDKSKFEVYGFSFGPDGAGALSNRVRRTFDTFTDVKSLSDRAVTALAREMEIDIAFDLKGFTQDARTSIFSERAAPIQINYLGFPGSMGAPYIDYILADRYTIPLGAEIDYTEKVIRLPHCYQPNDNLRALPVEPQSRLDHGLPESAFVLCCFNNNYKITPQVFSIWMRVLLQFPHTVLWLLHDNQTAQDNLRMEATKRGIDPDRLVFAKRLNAVDHLARHQCADLFIDTYPCNAHTTASDALWAELPMVTCSGNSFASRVAGSLLTHIGLEDLITSNLPDYEHKIGDLIANPQQLAALKTRLKHNKQTHPLFDTKAYTKDFEDTLLYLYVQHTIDSTKKPQSM